MPFLPQAAGQTLRCAYRVVCRMKYEGSYALKVPRDENAPEGTTATFCKAKVNILTHDEPCDPSVEWYLTEEYYDGFGVSRERINRIILDALPESGDSVSYSAEVEELGFQGDRYDEILDRVILKAVDLALDQVR